MLFTCGHSCSQCCICCGCSAHVKFLSCFFTIDTLDDDDEVLWALAEQVRTLVFPLVIVVDTLYGLYMCSVCVCLWYACVCYSSRTKTKTKSTLEHSIFYVS